MKIEVEQELIEKIANYLASKPWYEVKDMLSELITKEEPTEDVQEE